ncbi:MAG: hypothetical protein GY772_21720 [bacterium]|nr:hypothetical protein [bacterium]
MTSRSRPVVHEVRRRRHTIQRDHDVAAWLKEHDVAATTLEVAQAFGLASPTARDALNRLVTEGRAVRYGTGRGTLWVTT